MISYGIVLVCLRLARWPTYWESTSTYLMLWNVIVSVRDHCPFMFTLRKCPSLIDECPYIIFESQYGVNFNKDHTGVEVW